jgi:hypothetical protein
MNLPERELPDLDNWGCLPVEENSPLDQEKKQEEALNIEVEVIVDNPPLPDGPPPITAKKTRSDFFSLQALLALAGDSHEIEVQRTTSTIP